MPFLMKRVWPGRYLLEQERRKEVNQRAVLCVEGSHPETRLCARHDPIDMLSRETYNFHTKHIFCMDYVEIHLWHLSKRRSH